MGKKTLAKQMKQESFSIQLHLCRFIPCTVISCESHLS